MTTFAKPDGELRIDWEFGTLADGSLTIRVRLAGRGNIRALAEFSESELEKMVRGYERDRREIAEGAGAAVFGLSPKATLDELRAARHKLAVADAKARLEAEEKEAEEARIAAEQEAFEVALAAEKLAKEQAEAERAASVAAKQKEEADAARAALAQLEATPATAEAVAPVAPAEAASLAEAVPEKTPVFVESAKVAEDPCVDAEGKLTRRAEYEFPGGILIDRCLSPAGHEGDHTYQDLEITLEQVKKLREASPAEDPAQDPAKDE